MIYIEIMILNNNIVYQLLPIDLHVWWSQNGILVVNLHPHNSISEIFSSTVNLTGLKPEPSWLLSQNGYLRLNPQLHHLYLLLAVLGFSTLIGPIIGEAGIGLISYKSLSYSFLSNFLTIWLYSSNYFTFLASLWGWTAGPPDLVLILLNLQN